MVTSDGASSVDPLGRLARKGRAYVMHGAAMLAGLLLLCGGASAQTKDARQQVLPVMPDALIGVWHSNDRDGRLDCEAYRKIESAGDITEETSGLVGGLMITSHLVHAYSDYGEGNFYLVKRVVGLGNQQWEVDTLVGIDSMPSKGVGDFKGAFRFAVVSGLLSMTEVGAAEGTVQASNFFRCGKVLDGMYLEFGDAGS